MIVLTHSHDLLVDEFPLVPAKAPLSLPSFSTAEGFEDTNLPSFEILPLKGAVVSFGAANLLRPRRNGLWLGCERGKLKARCLAPCGQSECARARHVS